MNKQNLKIVIMFLLLFALVIGAIFLMSYQSKQLLNVVSLYDIEEDSVDMDEAGEIENSWNRLRLIKNAVAVSKSHEYIDMRDLFFGEEMEKYIMNTLVEQLEILSEVNAIPTVAGDEIKGISILKESYITKARGNSYVINLWRIYAECSDFYIYAYMDEDIAVIYDLTLTMKEGVNGKSYSIGHDRFFEYLKKYFEEQVIKYEEFGTIVHQGEKEISMYIISKNTQTEKVTSYRFNDVVTNAQSIAE